MEDAFIFATVGIIVVGWVCVATARSISRERTKRDIMAYVAEGTISPDDAARLLQLQEDAELRRKLVSQNGWEWDQKAYQKTLDKVLGSKGEGAPEAGDNPPLRPTRESVV